MSKHRKASGLFLAEGERCVEQILENGFVKVEEIIFDESFDAESLSAGSIPSYNLPGKEFNEIADTETPQGVIAVCRQPDESSPDQLASQSGVIVAFDAIQDPGNLGTMIRTASWFGAEGLIIGSGTVDPFHPKVVRSTAGATGAIPYLKGELSSVFEQFEKEDWQCCLLDGGDGAEDLSTFQPGQKTILVVGNEANGISPVLKTESRVRLRIPGDNHTVESLNAAVALSIALYALNR